MFDRASLPDKNSKARLIGRDGAKKRDIEFVSGASLVIRNTEVEILAPDEEKMVLAKKLIHKCIQHGLAANRVVDRQQPVVDCVKKDLVMAAHYTLHN